VRALADAGVDELACLIDFGIEPGEAIQSLTSVDELRRAHRDEVAEKQHSFTALCARHGVTLLQGTPSLLAAIASEPQALQALRGARVLLVGGEAFPAGLAERLLEALPSARILNMYGPTETTIWSTTHELDRERDIKGGTISIGRPIANTTLQIMDRRGQPVPIGVPGELWIGGDGVAVGYLGQPELTAERFVEYADRGRFYRTGDRVRWRADGTVDFLGRMDRQVKILGHRVEPDEIESVLSRHPEIESVAVVARSSANGTELIAYVSPAKALAADAGIEETFVRRWGDLWQDTYASARATDDEFAGWTSSYDGRPIPPDQMREWLDHTVARIRGLRSRAVMDIGVGVGLILRELVACTELYHGVDISPAALAAARGAWAPAGRSPRTCTFATRALNTSRAHRRRASTSSCSTPSCSISRASATCARCSAMRSESCARAARSTSATWRAIELLPEFHTAVQLHRAPALQTIEELRSMVMRQLQDERELCISPLFFRDLAAELPEISEVRIELKRGRADNELTQFRYDVSLLVGQPAGSSRPPSRIAFGDCGGGLEELSTRLTGTAGPVLVTGIPNRRLLRFARASQLLREMPCKATAWDLDRLLWEVDESAAVHPEDLFAVASSVGREVRVIVPTHGRLDSFDAVFNLTGELS
jgi:hypothetical protein